jgi:hypothetical protein
MGRFGTVERALLRKLFYSRWLLTTKLLDPSIHPTHTLLGFPSVPPSTRPLDKFSTAPDGISSIADWSIRTTAAAENKDDNFIDDDDILFDSKSQCQIGETGSFIRTYPWWSTRKLAAFNLQQKRFELFQDPEFHNNARDTGIPSSVDPTSTWYGLARSAFDATYRHKQLGQVN